MHLHGFVRQKILRPVSQVFSPSLVGSPQWVPRYMLSLSQDDLICNMSVVIIILTGSEAPRVINRAVFEGPFSENRHPQDQVSSLDQPLLMFQVLACGCKKVMSKIKRFISSTQMTNMNSSILWMMMTRLG